LDVYLAVYEVPNKVNTDQANHLGELREGKVGLSDSESSPIGIMFGNSKKPVINAQRKSATTMAAGANSQIPTCQRCGSEKIWFEES
jgi:hypothetical protein